MIFCPEISNIKDYYKLTNSYIETVNKDSFGIEIMKWNKDEKGEGYCANDDDIRELASGLVVT